jgi:hypothetical protein
LKINCLLYLAILSILCAQQLHAQNIKSDKVSYFYTRLPSQPIDKGIKNYTVLIEAPYEEKNRFLLEEYRKAQKAANDKYEKELAEYPVLVKAAEDRYDKEMAEYNKKNFGEKLAEKTLLNENNKPVKQIPSKPYLQQLPKPILQTSYDYKVLAATYLNLEGYQPNLDNAVSVVITLYGYDFTQPRTLSEQKDMLRIGSGNTSTYKSTYYHTEFSYRHPMAIKVSIPGGKELLNLTPSELNIYKVQKSTPSDNYKQVNPELMIKTHEEKLLQDNLIFLNNLLNNKFGFSQVKREAELYYVKSNDEYADLTTALNEASAALLMLQQDASTAKTKLEKAIRLWNEALKESDPSNKKARIDKDVTIAICFNLLETHFAMGNAEGGRIALDKLNTLSLSGSEKKQKNDYEMLFSDLSARIKNNQ